MFIRVRKVYHKVRRKGTSIVKRNKIRYTDTCVQKARGEFETILT